VENLPFIPYTTTITITITITTTTTTTTKAISVKRTRKTILSCVCGYA
jgi:hypothetical protein